MLRLEKSTEIFLRNSLLAGAVGLAACAPTESTPTPTPEISLEIKDLFMDDDATPEERREIENMLQLTEGWYWDKKIPTAGEVNVYAYKDADKAVDKYFQQMSILGTPISDQSGHVRQNYKRSTTWAGSAKEFYIITGSPGWNNSSPILSRERPVKEGRIHSVVHERFHNFQYSIKAFEYHPVNWLNEGGAHYVAAVMLDETGKYPYQKIREGHVTEAAKLSEKLVDLEDEKFFQAGNPGTADEYSLSFLGVEFLTEGLPNRGIDALVDYWQKIAQGVTHPQALERAFGKKNFYPEFETYRQQGFKTR